MSITADPGVAVARLRAARRVLLTGHRSPDGDCLGSELALAELVRSHGGTATIVNRDPSPSNLAALPGAAAVVIADRLPPTFEQDFDLVVTVECPGLDRPGLDGLDRRPILNIDHHPSNDEYGEVNFLDDAAPAVGEMVWQMFHSAGVAPDAGVATNLYVALTTDTGDFRYSNATPRAFRVAAEMVAAGADPVVVSEWVHDGRSAASVRLLGEALTNLHLSAGGQLATLAVDERAFERAAAGPADTEEIVNQPRAIEGVRVVAFFKQWEPGVVRISMRSKGALDVRRVAAELGGGGHPNAAGCTVEGSLDDVRRRVSATLEEILEADS